MSCRQCVASLLFSSGYAETQPLPPQGLTTTLYLTTLHSIVQASQFPISHSHVVLAHCTVFETPALSIVIHQLCCLAGEEEGFLVVLEKTRGRGRELGEISMVVWGDLEDDCK